MNQVTSQAPPKNDNLLAALCHLTGLFTYLLPFLGNFILLLIIWAVKRKDSPLIDESGKAALNFQISMLIYLAIGVVACGISFLLFAIVRMDILVIGMMAMAGVFLIFYNIFYCVFIILAAITASEGRVYNYPLAIRFIQ